MYREPPKPKARVNSFLPPRLRASINRYLDLQDAMNFSSKGKMQLDVTYAALVEEAERTGRRKITLDRAIMTARERRIKLDPK